MLLITAMFLTVLPTIMVEANSITEGPWTPVLSDPEELGDWADLKALYAKIDQGNLTFKVEYYGNMSDLTDFRFCYIMLDADQDNTTGATTPYYEGIAHMMYYYWGSQPLGWPYPSSPVWGSLIRAWWNETASQWEWQWVMMLNVSTLGNDTAYITAPLESLGYPTAVDVFVWTGTAEGGGQGPPMGNFMDTVIQTWNYTSGIDTHNITVDGDPTDWNWPGISPNVTDDEDRDTYRFIDVTDFYMTDNSTHFFFRVDTALPPVKTLQNESAELIYQHIVAFDVDQDNTTGAKEEYIGLDAALFAGVHVNSSIGWEGYTQGMLWNPDGSMGDVFSFDVAVNSTCEFSVSMDQINEVNGTGIDGLFYASMGMFYDWMPQEGYGTFTLPHYLIVDVRATLSWWDTAVVTARVTNQTIPILDATVTANVTLPDNTVLGSIALYDDGTHGDPVAGDANYTNTFPITQMGPYRVKVHAIKNTTKGTGYQTLRAISPQEATSFIAGCQNPDRGFSERDVQATGLAVEALSSLGELGQINGTKTIDLIASRQQLGGGFGGPYRTYWAVKALQNLGGLSEIDKDSAINSLVSQQCREDGDMYGGWGDLQETCRAIIALKILGGLGHPELNVTAATEFIKIRQNLDGGFCNWPGEESRMWETSMAVGALDALGVLAEMNQAQAIAWLASCQNSQEGGFSERPGEGPNIQPTHGALQALEDLGGMGSVNSTRAGEWLVGCQKPDGGFNDPWSTLSNLESSYCVIDALKILGNLSIINQDEAVRFIMSYYDLPSGCFRRDTEAQKTRDALHALWLLGALDQIDCRAAADYLASCQFPYGGFCSNPALGDPDVSSTFAAVSALDLVGRLDTVNITRVIYYLATRQKTNGGFVNWYGEDPDMERTSYAVQALEILDGLSEINQAQAIAWLASCQNPDGGFSWMPEEDWSDLWCTYLAVRALETLGGLSAINVTSVIEYLASQQDSWSGAFWGDVRPTYAALHTLSILGALDSIDAQLAADYLIRCQNPDGGFGDWDRDTWSYLGNTYYSIQGIQLVSGLPEGDIMPPEINVLSPQNITYTTDAVDLTFTISEPTSWICYSLDGQANMTITGNMTLTGLPDGQHSIIVYANDTVGNMGSSDAVYFTVDTTPPTIETPSRVPTGDVMPDQNVTISVNVTDATSEVDGDRVTLSYHNGTSWNNVTMNYNSTTTLYEGTIPGQPADTNIQYKIIAYDNAGNVAVEEYELGYYAYIVIPEFPLAMLLPLLMFATLVVVMLAKKRRREKP